MDKPLDILSFGGFFFRRPDFVTTPSPPVQQRLLDEPDLAHQLGRVLREFPSWSSSILDDDHGMDAWMSRMSQDPKNPSLDLGTLKKLLRYAFTGQTVFFGEVSGRNSVTR